MATPSYIKTNTVFDRIRDQIAAVVRDAEEVIIFDGDLEEAIEYHFKGEMKRSTTFIMFGFAEEDVSIPSGGSGGGIHADIVLDFYVCVSMSGTTRYRQDRERLYDLSDEMRWAVFEPSSDKVGMYTTAIQRAQFQSRQRALVRPEILAHQIRFLITPRRS